jgi:myo-inositol 2-dehydrogenase / D-chiro-inositol 1-dehydrogenase
MSFKIAVIGCGWISTNSHGPAYAKYAQSHADVELTAACDLDIQRAEQFCARFGFLRPYSNTFEMLDVEHPDAVCLNVPETATCEMGCQIMQRGYPLLAEKPPGLTTGEIDRLIETAKSSGVIHQAAFNRRFAPLVGELKNRLAGNPIQHIDHAFYRIGRTRGDFSTTAIHAIDTVRFLAGSDYQHLNFHYQEFPEYGTAHGVANYFLDCTFRSGATAALSICPVTGMNVERTIIHSNERTFILKMNLGPDAPGSLQVFEKGQLIVDLNAARYCDSSEDFILSGFENENAIFFEAVRNHQHLQNDFASSRQSIEIMQAIHERHDEYRL